MLSTVRRSSKFNKGLALSVSLPNVLAKLSKQRNLSWSVVGKLKISKDVVNSKYRYCASRYSTSQQQFQDIMSCNCINVKILNLILTVAGAES